MKAVDILRKVPLFRGLSRENLTKILPLFEEEIYPEESHIIREGSVGDSLYIISRGSVRVMKSVKNDDQLIINNMEKEAYFGELALIDNLPRSASIVTNENTTVLRLRKTIFDDLLNGFPEIARIFYKNCLTDTFTRYRKITSDFTLSKHDLLIKSMTLEEINKDLLSAKKLQDFFINSKTLDYNEYPVKGMRQTFVYKPSQEIGGDFLNLVEVGHGKYGVVIADVMGHGITAALATGALKSAFSIMIKDAAENPSLLLARLNNHFFKDISTLFVSCLYAYIDMGHREITMARAGHYFPLFYKKNRNQLLKLSLRGPALGLKQHVSFEQNFYSIESGDKILFFTDGVIEQKNEKGEMYSENRLRKNFLDLSPGGKSQILHKIENDLNRFSSPEKTDDDITLLLLEFDF